MKEKTIKCFEVTVKFLVRKEDITKKQIKNQVENNFQCGMSYIGCKSYEAEGDVEVSVK